MSRAHDEQAFDVRHMKIASVLISGHIPPTLKWAIAMLSLGARVLCVHRVGSESFMTLCTSMFEQRVTARALLRDDFPSWHELTDMRARLVELFRDAGVAFEQTDVAAHLVVFAASAAELRDLTRDAWVALSSAMFADAEADYALMQGPSS